MKKLICWLPLLLVICCLTASAQTEAATVSGRISDPQGAVVSGADVQATNIDTGVSVSTKTNSSGIYVIPNLPPGNYRLTVRDSGFKEIVKTGLILHVQDTISQNFAMEVGSTQETVTVTGGAPLVNSESAAVSTVVDRNFAENLPMNGRSFQTLIELTPGVVTVPSNPVDSGQFSINGQRAVSNYWMVDGVSANIGIGAGSTSGDGFAGTLGSFSALGGTNSLVSVDAMQEFRLQTSTYAPEFGRTPGGQISIVTRSGTSQFHSTAFEYLRNDALDANNWFNGYTNVPPLPKARERQSDFGGTFSGPILKDRTFFFFSYEGLRLRLPQTALTSVPGANPADPLARQNAVPAVRRFLSAYPLPNGPQATDSFGNPVPGAFDFNASYSNPATVNAYSLRVDHKLNRKLTLFGRYNYSPSEIAARGGSAFSLSTVSVSHFTIQTATVGFTSNLSPTTANELRFNYSRTHAADSYLTDRFAGAIPLTSVPYPTPFTNHDAQFVVTISSLTNGGIAVGQNGTQIQRQINIVDGLSVQKGTHGLKFGADFRRLAPVLDPPLYQQFPNFLDMSSAASATLNNDIVSSVNGTTFSFRDLGLYAQDTWRLIPRFTITYGLRWDIGFVPHAINGPNLPAVTGFNLNNLSNLAIATAGTPLYQTALGNVAPRVGIAYQLLQNQRWQTVIRGGFGVFYDLATSELGSQISPGFYPFGASTFLSGPGSGGTSTFPLNPSDAAPPAITAPSSSNPQPVSAIDPHLRSPYTLEWNAAVEVALGSQQSISASYIGAAGKRLLQTAAILSPPIPFLQATLVTNAGQSDYNALQLEFQRQLSRGLQALASYAWSHSIDTGSAGSIAVPSNELVPGSVSTNRGSSDFDIRNAFSVGLTYDLPSPKVSAVADAILRGWSTENVFLARSAPPVNVNDGNFLSFNGTLASIRPDFVPGSSLYLYGSQYPGGKAFNQAAFTDPPSASNGCPFACPARQGDTSRNFLRGFGATQWDFAVHRTFVLHEAIKLQFRAEMFNVLNHPNFGQPSGCFGVFCTQPFGKSTVILAQYLDSADIGSNVGGGALSPLYQIGGPRSVQLALKLEF